MNCTFLICIEDAVIALDVYETITTAFPKATVQTDLQFAELDWIMGAHIGPVCLITQWEGEPTASLVFRHVPPRHVHLGDRPPPSATQVVSLPFSNARLTAVLRDSISPAL